MICHKNHVYLIQRHILCFLAALRCFFFSLFVCSGFSPLFFSSIFYVCEFARHGMWWVMYVFIICECLRMLEILFVFCFSLCVGRLSAYAPLHPHKDALHTHICPVQDVCHRNHCVKVWKVVDIYLLHRIFFLLFVRRAWVRIAYNVCVFVCGVVLRCGAPWMVVHSSNIIEIITLFRVCAFCSYTRRV